MTAKAPSPRLLGAALLVLVAAGLPTRAMAFTPSPSRPQTPTYSAG